MTPGLAGLPLKGANLTPNLTQNVGQTQKVRLGSLQLSFGLAFLDLEPHHPRGFLKNRPSVFGSGGKNLVDLTLFHDGVRGPADPGVQKESLDVLEPAIRPVQGVLAQTVPKYAPGNLYLVVIRPQNRFTVGEGQGNFRHPARPPASCPVKNNVRHFLTPQSLGGLLPQNPPDGIQNITFSGPVRTDNRGDSLMELEDRPIAEGLKPLHLQPLQLHCLPCLRTLTFHARKSKMLCEYILNPLFMVNILSCSPRCRSSIS